MRRPNLLPQPVTASGYLDAIGRRWNVGILDRLLDNAAVLHTVQSLYVNALCNTDSGRDFSPGLVWSWLKGQYRREEVIALYLLLVTRFRDLQDAKLVESEPRGRS